MSQCDRCDYFILWVRNLEKTISYLKRDNDEAIKKIDQLDGYEKKYKEIKASQDRRYDSYVTDPVRGFRCDDCDTLKDFKDTLEYYAKIPIVGRKARRALDCN